jgi:Transposase domain (DUF772)
MSWKNLAQTSLSDTLVKHHAALEELDGIHQLIDWREIEIRLSGVHAKKQGEQVWPPLLMFSAIAPASPKAPTVGALPPASLQSKALLLQSWYGLGDPGLEKQLARDLMFRRFINLGLSKGVSGHSTIWRFRNTLTKQGLLDTLLLEVNRQLSAKGLYIKTGEAVIVDATVIEAKQSRPRLCPLGARARTAGTPGTARRATTSRSPPTARRPALTATRRMSTSMKTASSRPSAIPQATNMMPSPWKNCSPAQNTSCTPTRPTPAPDTTEK